MKFNLIMLLSIFLAALLTGAIAAFLLFVPVMSVAVVSSVVLVSVLMFGLGLQAGRRRLRITRHKNPSVSTLSPAA